MVLKEVQSQSTQLRWRNGEASRYHYERYLEHAPRLFLQPGKSERLTVMRYQKPGYVEKNMYGGGSVLLRQLPVSVVR
jgi:hypothetical protein